MTDESIDALVGAVSSYQRRGVPPGAPLERPGRELLELVAGGLMN